MRRITLGRFFINVLIFPRWKKGVIKYLTCVIVRIKSKQSVPVIHLVQCLAVFL